MQPDFGYFTPPPEICLPRDPLQAQRQGADPHSPHDEGLMLSPFWQVEANGIPVPVLATPVALGGPHSFCQLELADAGRQLELTLTPAGKLFTVAVHPESEGLCCHVQQHRVHLTTHGPGTYTVEANGRIDQPLTLFLCPPEADIPQRDDPNVLWFGPGLHRISSIELKDDQTLYLASGAVLQALPPAADEMPALTRDWAGMHSWADFIRATGCKNVRVAGRGIIDTSRLPWHARRTLWFQGSTGVRAEGVTLLGAAHWTAVVYDCTDVAFTGLKLLGYRENSDGIDIVSSSRVLVQHCFVRTGDDCICLKTMLPSPHPGSQGVLVEHCTVWSDKVRALGITGETKSHIRSVLFRHCTVLHSMACWARELGSLCIILGDSGSVEEIRFEAITIHQENASAINCMILKDRWSTDRAAGRVQGVTFHDIALPHGAPLRFTGYDAHHRVEDVRLEDIRLEGPSSLPLWLEVNEYVSNIQMIP